MSTDPRPSLDELLDLARHHVMSREERYAQRISFAYGNVSMANPRITRDMVEREARKLYGDG